jgi:hypothetical protein
MPPPVARPGLAKIRPLVVRERVVRLISASDARLHALLAGADVMTEGRSVEESGRLVYYGSTSVVLSAERAGTDLESLALLARFDPHLRTRVLRLACTESVRRAGTPIEPISSEVAILVRGGDVVIVVDLTSVVRDARTTSARR